MPRTILPRRQVLVAVGEIRRLSLHLSGKWRRFGPQIDEQSQHWLDVYEVATVMQARAQALRELAAHRIRELDPEAGSRSIP